MGFITMETGCMQDVQREINIDQLFQAKVVEIALEEVMNAVREKETLTSLVVRIASLMFWMELKI